MLSHINVGTGIDCSIRELVVTIAKVVGYQGEIKFDTNKPDGTVRKLMNVDRISSLGWQYSYNLLRLVFSVLSIKQKIFY